MHSYVKTLVFIDSSGSHVDRASDIVNKRVWSDEELVWFFDDNVYPIFEESHELVGCGPTNYQCIIDTVDGFVKKWEYHPRVLVYTDGEATFPEVNVYENLWYFDIATTISLKKLKKMSS